MKKKSYIELIAVYIHPKNSNHLRSHLRTIMALDHSRSGLENEFLENKSGRIFCVRQVYLTKSCQQLLGACKPTFHTFYTSHLRWNSNMRRRFYHTDLRQNAVFHNFLRQMHSFNIQKQTKHVWDFRKSVKNHFQNHQYGQAVLHFGKRQISVNIKRVTLQIKNLLCLFF